MNFNFPDPNPFLCVEAVNAADAACESIQNKIAQNCKSAILKEPEDMTEDEKFAVAYMAGVPLIPSPLDGMFKMQTVPCGITKQGGKYMVHYFEKDERI